MPDTGTFDDEFARSIASSSLHLVILPTEKCNFRCTYCYEDFSVGRMTDATVSAVEAFVTNRLPSLTTLSIEWFGGEPLLAAQVIWRISRAVLDTASGTNPGLVYRAGITTNGWHLDQPTAEKLVAHGVARAQVSLDGPQSLHDASRPRIDGTGSYQRIHANLQALLASTVPLDVLLRVHLTPANASVMPAFVDELRERYLGDPRFSLLLTRVGHLGGPNDSEFEILSDRDTAALISELNPAAPGAASAVKADRLDIMEAGGNDFDVCYAAKLNSLVIRADGRLAKCTVALSQPSNDVGWINPDGSLTTHDARIRTWASGWFTGDRSALACPWETVPELARPEHKLLPLRPV